MAAITEKQQVCLSFGWVGSNQRTEKETHETVKVVYIYNLYKLPVCVQIPDQQVDDPHLKPLPFICGYGTDLVLCSTETLSVDREKLNLLSIKVAVCATAPGYTLNRDNQVEIAGSTQQSYFRNVKLKTKFEKLTDSHYRLAINGELKVFLLFDAQRNKAVLIAHLFDKMEAANGMSFYFHILFGSYLKRAANYVWQKLMLIPALENVRIRTDFASLELVDQAIADGVTQTINANQIVALYRECRPLFLHWNAKTQQQKEETAKATFKKLFDSCGSDWLKNIVQGHLLLVVNGTNDVRVRKMIEALSDEFVKQMIKLHYVQPTLQRQKEPSYTVDA